jgi:tRNA-Thr(GGU) m(6)t(6)A37 methyltransferase TsaA
METFTIEAVGAIRSALKSREDAPKQGYEGAPDAWLVIYPAFAAALNGVEVGDEIILVTWFHLGRRDVLEVHPRGDSRNPMTGVFATRSPDRPNPLGLHRVRVLQISGMELRVGPLEALDGTPVVDIKPVLERSGDG